MQPSIRQNFLQQALDFVLLKIKSFLLREKSLTEFDPWENRQNTPQIWRPRRDWKGAEWTTALELTDEQHTHSGGHHRIR